MKLKSKHDKISPIFQATVTRNHPGVFNGSPVLVIDGEAYGTADTEVYDVEIVEASDDEREMLLSAGYAITGLDLGDWITVQETAAILGVSRVRVRRVITDGGKLDVKRFGWAWMVSRKSAIELRDNPRPVGNPNWIKKTEEK